MLPAGAPQVPGGNVYGQAGAAEEFSQGTMQRSASQASLIGQGDPAEPSVLIPIGSTPSIMHQGMMPGAGMLQGQAMTVEQVRTI